MTETGEVDEIPEKGYLALYFFKFARVATREQVIAFSKISDAGLDFLLKKGLLDKKTVDEKYKSFYLLTSQGVSLLAKSGIRVPQQQVLQDSFDKDLLTREVGITEAILKEVEYGWVAITREFIGDDITPDVYIERGEGTSFFIDFIDSNSTRGELLERFVKYGKSQYIESRDSYLYVYYSISESENINKRKDLIASVLSDQNLGVVFKEVHLTAIEMDNVIRLKRN